MVEASLCGLFDCAKCKIRERGQCLGCAEGNLYLERWGRETCKIYACARSRELSSCDECSEIVCALRGTTDSVCPLRSGAEKMRHWAWRIARHLEARGKPCRHSGALPQKTLARLRWYLDALANFEERGIDVVSSREVGDRVGISSAMVRKDLSRLGDTGTPGLGYNIHYLQSRIRDVLDRNICQLVWVGAQWLENAAGVLGSETGVNFRIVAAVDSRPEWIGRQVGHWKIQPLSDLRAIYEKGAHGAVMALPEDVARATDALVAAGTKGILNLTPSALRVPPDVTVHHLDLLGEMMALASEVGAPDDLDPGTRTSA